MASHDHRGRLLAVLLMAPFMAQADATIANVATPAIHADLGASGAELELVIGGYLIAFAVLLIAGARLGQTHGYRRVFLLGVGVFTVASLAAGLAPGPLALVVARVIQGAGAALMFPQTLTGIQLSFEGAARVRAIGLYAIALSCGAVAGQSLGGALVSADVLGSAWRSIFFVNVPVGVAVLVAGARLLPRDATAGARRVDVAGVVALGAAVALMAVPLVLGRAEGWPAWTFASLAASLPALALFVAAERRAVARGRPPLIDLGALAPRPVAWGLLAVGAATGTYYALLFALAQYLQQGLGRSALVSGLTLVSWVAAFGAAGQVVRRLPARVAPAAAPVGCLVLAGAYLAVSGALFAGRHPEGLLVVVLGVGGLGLGTQFSAMIAHLTSAVSERHAPDISGVTTTVMQIAATLGVAVFGTAYLGLAADPGPAAATHAFAIVTALLAVVAALAAVAAQRATQWRRRRSASVTRTPSSDTAGDIFDSPATRSLKTNGTSSMRLPMR